MEKAKNVQIWNFLMTTRLVQAIKIRFCIGVKLLFPMKFLPVFYK